MTQRHRSWSFSESSNRSLSPKFRCRRLKLSKQPSRHQHRPPKTPRSILPPSAARLRRHHSRCRPRRAHHHYPTPHPFPRLLVTHNSRPPRHHLAHDGAVFDLDYNGRSLLPAYRELSKSRGFIVVEPRMIWAHPSWMDCEFDGKRY